MPIFKKTKCRMKWCYSPLRHEDGTCDRFCTYNTYEVKTNGDRIRAMSDEELAEFLDKWEAKDIDYSLTFCNMCKGEMYDCRKDCLMQWLKKEVKDGSF